MWQYFTESTIPTTTLCGCWTQQALHHFDLLHRHHHLACFDSLLLHVVWNTDGLCYGWYVTYRFCSFQRCLMFYLGWLLAWSCSMRMRGGSRAFGRHLGHCVYLSCIWLHARCGVFERFSSLTWPPGFLGVWEFCRSSVMNFSFCCSIRCYIMQSCFLVQRSWSQGCELMLEGRAST